MKRWMFTALFATILVLPLSAATHKIFLNTGKVINANSKPVVQGKLVYFYKNGMYLYLPVSQVDMAKTEKAGEVKEKPVPPTQPKAEAKPSTKAPIVIDQQKLEEISKHSRLANEGELEESQPQNVNASSPSKGAPHGAGGNPNKQRDMLQSQLNSLRSQQSALQQRMVNLHNELSGLQNQYNFSTQQSDREALQQQINAKQQDIANAQDQMTGLNSQIQNVQEELSTIPVVVPSGGAQGSSGGSSPPDNGPGY